MGLRDRRIEIKTPDQIAVMRKAGLVVAETLELLRDAVAPGVTTRELDRLAEQHIRARGATSNFLGYHGFPATICTSVNDEVVHGIPGPRVLRDGDVVSLDCGGMAAACLGGHITDISAAVESHVRSQGRYGIVEDYVGHGIGSAMHMPPSVPNYGRAGKGPKLVQGMALAVEPMITLGGIDTHVLDDDWTVVTDDNSWSAHFEHSFTLTPKGALVLTALDGGAARLAQLGVPCAA
jgi:methionyl aminopeptidase